MNTLPSGALRVTVPIFSHRDHLPKGAFMPSRKSHTLVFEYNGHLFQPTKATRKLLEKFRQAGPERWGADGDCRGV